MFDCRKDYYDSLKTVSFNKLHDIKVIGIGRALLPDK